MFLSSIYTLFNNHQTRSHTVLLYNITDPGPDLLRFKKKCFKEADHRGCVVRLRYQLTMGFHRMLNTMIFTGVASLFFLKELLFLGSPFYAFHAIIGTDNFVS